jgi:hypothetical protein
MHPNDYKSIPDLIVVPVEMKLPVDGTVTAKQAGGFEIDASLVSLLRGAVMTSEFCERAGVSALGGPGLHKW